MISFFPLRAAPPLLAAMLLGACTSFSADGGFDAVQQAAQQRLSQPTRWSRSASDADEITRQVHSLLGSRLTADAAVQIALINNRTLQAAYNELGLAEADLIQASRLPNPGLAFSRTHSGGDIKLERSLSLSVMRLLTMPTATRIESQRFEQTKLRLAEQMLRTAALARKAYYQAIAASQSEHYQEQVRQAAELAGELALRMAARGNFSQLDAARQQAFQLDTETALTRARIVSIETRENLLRLLGLSSTDPALQLPPQLPALPLQAPTLADVERSAMQQRLDVQAARQDLASLQSVLGLSRATRFVNVLDLGYVRNSESGKAAEVGYQISLEIPLFDWGQARVAKAEARYMQAAQQLAATAIQAQSEVRSAYAITQHTYRLARQYQDVALPLRKRIADETLLRYNGMLVSVFELLADAREQATTVSAAIDAARDYWSADCDLQLALGGSLAWSAQQQQQQTQQPVPSIPAAAQPGNHHD